MMSWETVIGLEIHAQLATRSKIFSSAATAYGAAPNAQANLVDLGYPGVLPVLNREAVRMAVKFGLAVGAQISPRSIFARKNYFYPDLPKGYQISQYETPVVGKGKLQIMLDDGTVKTIGITRAHLEEDAGKSLHEDFHGLTGIDLNRAGTPLLEIVSEPDMRSAKEAVAYMKKIHTLVRYLEICDGNMQEGSFRCDANVSVRPAGEAKLGTRCEIKNLNSFRFLEQAIEFEVRRQTELLEDGGTVVQETRLFDPARHETRSMRSKEDAHDYRYFPDPDLPPLVVDDAWIARVTAALPELPEAMKARFETQYGLTAYDARTLTSSRDLAAYFEAVVGAVPGSAKLAANWIMGEVAAALNKANLEIADVPVSALRLAGLLARIDDGTISAKIARDVFDAMWAGQAPAVGHAAGTSIAKGASADEIIEQKGLKQISDEGALERVVDEVLASNPAIVAEYRAGKQKSFNSLVGKAMQATRGKANPAQINAILKKKLNS
jgi:aspartyl-tRNA(Asn)/glutamyl-tRNA(Gln) amidotransferase subunit B